MSMLRRLLKTRSLTPWLEDARVAARGDMSLAVLDGGTVLAACGSVADLGSHPGGDILSFPLQAGEEGEAGRLLLLPGPGADRSLCLALGRLLVRSLQEVVDRGLAQRAVTAETLDQYREASLFHRAATTLNQSLHLPEVTQALLAECAGATQAEMGMVFGFDDEQRRFEPLGSFGPVGETALHRVAEGGLFLEVVRGGRGEIVNELAADSRWRREVPSLACLLCLPLKSPGNWAGGLVLGSRRQDGYFSAADLKRISTIASVAATAMANAHHFEQLQRMLQALVRALATAIDSRDPCTAGHSQRVARYARGLAAAAVEAALLPPASETGAGGHQEIYFAGLLHDVGKIGVAEEVLTKSTRLRPGQAEAVRMRLATWSALNSHDCRDDLAHLERLNRANSLNEEDADFVCALAEKCIQVGDEAQCLLTDQEKARLLIPRGNLTSDEWDNIRRHPAESHRILAQIPFPAQYRQVPTIIKQHHEKLDGTGYPDGVGEKDILLPSRILAIVDIYDALTASDRPYKKAMPREKALAILRQEASSGKLDQPLVELFCDRIEQMEALARQGDA